MTDTCVSLTTGTLSPYQRVNYAYGMVLGVDEFLTEQQHRLEKGYLHERALHGYGTVYGLHVTAGQAADDADDVEVRVSTGMLIDQYGREAVITCDQCARLGAWLAAQEQASPGTVASHRGPSGELVVYVVARYASCLDALVPLPGTPCSSSAQSSVASRVRDAWDVDLTFELPPMPRWDTDRRLARLLGSVEIVAGLPQDQSSEDDIVAAVLTLPSRADDGPDDLFPDLTPSGSPSALTGLRLPAETAAEALDRIFTVWVTQVRPFLEPDLTTPEAANPSGPDGTDADPAVHDPLPGGGPVRPAGSGHHRVRGTRRRGPALPAAHPADPGAAFPPGSRSGRGPAARAGHPGAVGQRQRLADPGRLVPPAPAGVAGQPGRHPDRDRGHGAVRHVGDRPGGQPAGVLRRVAADRTSQLYRARR